MSKEKLILPSVQYLKECFALDEQTGTLIWRVRPREHFRTERGWKTFNAQKSGCAAGTLSEDYLVISINKKLYKVHRIIFKMVNGADPVSEVDHRNVNPSDNRPNNLRDATPTQNKLNKRGWKKSASGIKGVYPRDGKWTTKLRLPGSKTVNLGVFDSKSEAAAEHARAAAEFHGEFARSGASS